MDGISMVEKLRADSWGKNVPVVILTNLSDSQNITSGLNNKVVKYYVKSDWKLEDLVGDIKELMTKLKTTQENEKISLS